MQPPDSKASMAVATPDTTSRTGRRAARRGLRAGGVATDAPRALGKVGVMGLGLGDGRIGMHEMLPWTVTPRA